MRSATQAGTRKLSALSATRKRLESQRPQRNRRHAPRPRRSARSRPFFLKRADRFVLEHLGEPFSVSQLATHCEVSSRTLQKAFADSRGITPVAYVRNARLDHARDALQSGDGTTVAEIAMRCGFKSSTTFAIEYRKRFGVSPSRAKRALGSP
jgi:transcriptional regulator GlxA family with amidase domain